MTTRWAFHKRMVSISKECLEKMNEAFAYSFKKSFKTTRKVKHEMKNITSFYHIMS